MKKQCIYIILLVALGAWSACSRDKIDPQQQMRDAIDVLLATGGKLETTAANSSETTLLDSDSLPQISYTDPVSELIYDAYPVKTTREYSVTDNPMEFVTLDPWDMLWPGALIQGGTLRDGIPASIPIYGKRRPDNIYLSVVSGDENAEYVKENVTMRPSNVTQAMNELLRDHLDSGFPARTSFEITSVSSVEELALKLGINLKLFGGKLRTEFGNSWSTEKNYVAVKLNQLFFTMSCDDPDGGFSGAFTDDITADDLKNYTGPGNPICFVSSVSYGRSFILLYESEKSSRELEFALSAAYSVVGTDISDIQKSVVNSSTCKLVQIGGDPQAGLATVFGDVQALRDFIEYGATVSSTNVGAPISYKIKHLHDNTLASLTNTLKYTVTTTEYHHTKPRNDVVIDIFNLKMGRIDGRGANIDGGNTYIQLKELWVSRGPVDNVEFGKDIKSFDGKPYSANIGSNIPIYNIYSLPMVDTSHRIRIYCKAYVQTNPYRKFLGARIPQNNTPNKEVTITLDFRYDNGTWYVTNPAAIGGEDSNQTQEFKKWYAVEAVGSTTAEITFNYSFTCDGQVYPKK